MSNSLQINGLEMCGYTTNPEYHLGTGMDFGEIAPDTTTISSLFLDGDVISGERTTNRTWNLTIVVQSYNDRLGLSTFVDTLLQAVNADTFQVIWTPDGCPSVTFDAYRATATPAKDFTLQDNDVMVTEVTLTFSTGPFGYSASLTTISVAATGGPQQEQIDGMNSNSPAFIVGTRDTSHEYEGASCMAAVMTRSFTLGPPTVVSYAMSTGTGRDLASVTDISAYSALSIRIRWAPPVTYNATLRITIQDPSGGSSTATIRANFVAGDTAYKLIRVDLSSFVSSGTPHVDFTQVSHWIVRLQSDVLTWGHGTTTNFPTTTPIYFDDLRVYPAASAGNSTGEGQVLTIPGVPGSARTPVSLQLDLGGDTFTDMVVHRPPNDQDPDLTILAAVALSGGKYQVSIPAANSNYDDTYTVVALLSSAPGVAKTLTAEFTQKIGGTTIGGPTDVALATSSGSFLMVLGEITLPLTPTPPENQSDSLTIALSSTGADVFTDVLLLSTRGQTVIVRGDPGTTEAMWIDQPDPLVGVGPVYGAASIDRTQAFSLMSDVIAYSGGPMLFDPGDNRLLVASAQGAPNAAASFFARWLDEALS